MKKWIDKVFAPGQPVKLILFNIIICFSTIGGIFSFIVSLSLGMTVMQVATIVISVTTAIWCFVLANFYGKMQTAILGACLTITIFVFPIMFFTGGGVHSGMPIWFLLAIVFVFLLLEKEQLLLTLTLQIILYTICFAMSYYYPQMVTVVEKESGKYLDVWQSMIIIAFVLGAIISFQNKLYNSMLRKQEEQNKQLTAARIEADRVKAELMETNKAYRELAYTDIMTHLRNRTAFETKMNELRQKDDLENVVIFLADLNDLKHINDFYGHSYGDDAIGRVAACISKCFVEKSSCYRIGGDEFCVICEDTTEKEFELLNNTFEYEFEKQVQEVNYPFSIATGYGEVNGQNIDETFREVDAKMYSDKSMMKKHLNRME